MSYALQNQIKAMLEKLSELEARIKELEAQKRQILTLKQERAPNVQSRS